MEELLCRGKRKDNGDWVYGAKVAGNAIIEWDSDFISTSMGILVMGFHEVIPETIGHNTGLTDKDNNEIYEGDIVRSDNYLNCYDTVVVYNKGCFWLDDPMVGMEDTLDATYMHSIVIGNKFDNQDILIDILKDIE